jgi:hypothetical protein
LRERIRLGPEIVRRRGHSRQRHSSEAPSVTALSGGALVAEGFITAA